MTDLQNQSDDRFDMIQMSVQGTWSKTAVSVPAQVLGSPRDGGAPVTLATGRATLSWTGEPTAIRIEGWKPGLDWDLLGGTMGPGEWVCTPVRVTPPQA
ncbi:hypothetical protein ACIPY6_28870 [Streptomyces sp. NPDC090054]|uniref:hypothetical protein n=1 Tax=Streptomyces sp. NPDC090054 TaxID=3365933 RepID=UPI0037FF0087